MPSVLSLPVRRLLLPVYVVALLVSAAVFAVGTVIGTLVAPLTPRRRILRLSAFALSYSFVELASLTAAGLLWLRYAFAARSHDGGRPQWVVANEALLAWALGMVLRAGHRCLGFRVNVVGSSDATPLSEMGPVLVLARHGGPGDSFALVHLLLTRYHRSVRIVLKDVLQLDPLIDILLHRLDCCFLASPSGDGAELCAKVAAMAATLAPRGSPPLSRGCELHTPSTSTRHQPVAPRSQSGARPRHDVDDQRPAPRPGGVLACLDGRPDLPVVVVAHAGLDRVVSVRQAWDELPITTPMTVRAWPTAPIPPGEDARLAWLTLEWAVVDEWVDAFHAGATVTGD